MSEIQIQSISLLSQKIKYRISIKIYNLYFSQMTRVKNLEVETVSLSVTSPWGELFYFASNRLNSLWAARAIQPNIELFLARFAFKSHFNLCRSSRSNWNRICLLKCNRARYLLVLFTICNYLLLFINVYRPKWYFLCLNQGLSLRLFGE